MPGPMCTDRQLFNAGDLDAVIALYDPEARFVTRSSETLAGRDDLEGDRGVAAPDRWRLKADHRRPQWTRMKMPNKPKSKVFQRG